MTRNPILRAVLARLVQAALVALTLATLCFVFLHVLPGDMALRLAIARYGHEQVSAELLASVRAEAWLSQPWPIRYGDWLRDVFSGRFGVSLVSGRPVMEELSRAAERTFLLAGLGLLASYLIALPLGLIAGLRPGGAVDRATAAFAAAVASLPSFLIGIALIWLLSLKFGWLPPAGSRTSAHLVLPALTLALGLAGPAARVLREAVAGAAESFHVLFSRIRGLSPARAVRRHVLRNAAPPVVAFAALQFAALLDGFVVVETLFNYPGLGDALVKALIARDVPMILGGALLIGWLYAFVSLLADLACLWLDPRLMRRAAP